MAKKLDAYLMKRGPVWYYKRAVPQDILELKPQQKPVIMVSLKTDDLQVARRMRDKIDGRYTADWETLRLTAAGIRDARSKGVTMLDAEDEGAYLSLDMQLEALRESYGRKHPNLGIDAIDDLILATPEGKAIKDGYSALSSINRLLERYLHESRFKPATEAGYRSALTRAISNLPHPTLVTPEIAKAFFRAEAQGRADSSLRQTRAALRGFWAWLEEEGTPVDVAVWDRVKTRGTNAPTKREPIPVELLRAIYRFLREASGDLGDHQSEASGDLGDHQSEASSDTQAGSYTMAMMTLDAFVVALHTGARLSEVLHSEYSLNQGLMTVKDSKTAAGIRTVPIHDAIWRGAYSHHLRRLIRHQPKLPPKAAQIVSHGWIRMRKILDIPSTMTFHSLRHTTVTMLRQAWVPVDQAKSLVGHKDRDVTFGLYGRKVDPEYLRDAINRLDVNLH